MTPLRLALFIFFWCGVVGSFVICSLLFPAPWHWSGPVVAFAAIYYLIRWTARRAC